MSPGAAPRTSSLRTNTRSSLLSRYEDLDRGTLSAGPLGRVVDDIIDRLRAAVISGATNEQIAHIVLGATDALDEIDPRSCAS